MRDFITIIVILIVIAVGFVFAYNFLSKNPLSDQEINLEANKTNNMEIITIKEGTGEEAKNGDKVTVNYVGTLENGTKFDSSIDRGEPFEFTLGAGEVIKGWDDGVKGMKVGEKRKLVIPSELGYGPQAVGSIPANSTLIFEVDLLKIN